MDNFVYVFSIECILCSFLKEFCLFKVCLIYFFLINNELWYIFKDNFDDFLIMDFLFDWFFYFGFFYLILK